MNDSINLHAQMVLLKINLFEKNIYWLANDQVNVEKSGMKAEIKM